MRRMLALGAAVLLLGSLAGTSLASTATQKLGFQGDFLQLADDGTAMGRITAQLAEPTEAKLVPGTHDFAGLPGNWVRESHAVIGHSAFWFDANHEGGSKVAYGDGVECVFFGVSDSVCHEWAVMFIDVLDPSVPNQVAYSIVRDADGAFDFDTSTGQAWWYTVGRGSFEMSGTFPQG